MRRTALVSSITNAAFLLVLSGAGDSRSREPATVMMSDDAHAPAVVSLSADSSGIVIALAEGPAEHPVPTGIEVRTTVIADSLADSLLSSLPQLPDTRAASFARRPDTPPPPRAGRVVTLPFPSPEPDRPASPRASGQPRVRKPPLRIRSSRPLEVERFAPQGAVGLESRIEVT